MVCMAVSGIFMGTSKCLSYQVIKNALLQSNDNPSSWEIEQHLIWYHQNQEGRTRMNKSWLK
jgi:hypothetical protein